MRPVDVSGWLVVVLVTVDDRTDGVMLGSRRYLMSLTAHGKWQVVVVCS